MFKTVSHFYDTKILPYMVDCACGVNVISRQRQKVVPKAAGHVLEIGIGTGLNLPHYDKTTVVKLTGIDPGLAHGLVQKRIDKSGLEVELVDLSAERLPFDDETFDAVVVTYSLCTIPDPLSALREMKRVLKVGGQLLYCEHGLSPDIKIQKWQRRLTPTWKTLAGGCRLDRHTPTLLQDAGFTLVDAQSGYVPGPKLMSYNYWGVASK